MFVKEWVAQPGAIGILIMMMMMSKRRMRMKEEEEVWEQESSMNTVTSCETDDAIAIVSLQLGLTSI
jgi:hypothetical protein